MADLITPDITIAYDHIWDKVLKAGPSKFLRLSSTNFTWYNLEYFVPYVAGADIRVENYSCIEKKPDLQDC